MRSLTFLLLLLVSSVSGTIYWGFGEESDDNNSIAIVDEIQTQINLILHAFENNDTDLLHQLTKNGGGTVILSSLNLQ
uniref:Secreted protein n=1 Tax=Caenorhabditis tropicalis TaxID=1561998 RepID=A0A1I7UP64_9PELO